MYRFQFAFVEDAEKFAASYEDVCEREDCRVVFDDIPDFAFAAVMADAHKFNCRMLP